MRNRFMGWISALVISGFVASLAAPAFAGEAEEWTALQEKLKQVNQKGLGDKAGLLELAALAEKYLANENLDAKKKQMAYSCGAQGYDLGGASDKAVAFCDKFIKSAEGPDKNMLMYLRAVALIKLEKADDVNKAIEELAKLDANSASRLKFMVVNALIEKGKLDDAGKAIEELAKTDTKAAAQAKYALVSAVIKQGKFEEAKKAIDELAKTDAAMAGQLDSQLKSAIMFQKGATPPAFTLKDLEGNEKSLESFKGQIVLLDFWATWCGPCKVLMKDHLKALHDEYGAKGFALVGIGCSWRGDTAEKQKKFGADNNYHWAKLFDPDNSVAQAYGVNGIPFCVLIDKEGKVVMAGNGGAIINDVKEYLKKNLK